jgi:hypothetical protein
MRRLVAGLLEEKTFTSGFAGPICPVPADPGTSETLLTPVWVNNS